MISTLQLKPRLLTAVIALFGVMLFLWANFPLPFLLGPMLMCLLFALGGVKMMGMGQLGMAFRTILGVAAGSSITPDVVSALPKMAGSLMLVPVFVVSVALLSFPLMRHLFKFDKVTSYYCAMPGGLQDLMVFGELAGANLRVLSLVHATRILLIVSVAPFVLNMLWQVDLLARPGSNASDTPLTQLAWMAFAGLAGWGVAARLNILGASIIGPMVLTAGLSLSGIITQRPPAEMIWACQFFIGMAVGAKYVGVTLGELRRVVLAGIANGVLLASVSAVFILAVSGLAIAPALDAFLAYLPGGQGEMVVLAIIAGADLTYVVLHHILRIALVVILAPLLLSRLK
ncbi:AbrB family transcriptional regulator [Parasedimentitalea huanghaiensis]|uniref:AbrB family transcriptional regulator n=1 Tax=Parasedimentitalea huanghaiensis TaxID=2682100 RepID=A0A6L6WFQ7_9RHOB|nr:AbrB family transcriptional regulator [Zongyanglinia huanghaiensis]MVO16673.1 AbrB family transcriptional regulator [Zongyanglinia huanghaiensis]